MWIRVLVAVMLMAAVGGQLSDLEICQVELARMTQEQEVQVDTTCLQLARKVEKAMVHMQKMAEGHTLAECVVVMFPFLLLGMLLVGTMGLMIGVYGCVKLVKKIRAKIRTKSVDLTDQERENTVPQT